VGDGLDAHHIVPKNEPIGAEGRAILAKHGIDIDDAANGVLVDPAMHPRDNAYYADVNRRLLDADRRGGYSEVMKTLDAIREDIRSGVYKR
jgi:hypothetical protein